MNIFYAPRNDVVMAFVSGIVGWGHQPRKVFLTLRREGMKVHEEEKRKLTKKPRRFDLRSSKNKGVEKKPPGLMRREEIFLRAQKLFFATKARRHEGARRGEKEVDKKTKKV
jgi:hypothetical protein